MQAQNNSPFAPVMKLDTNLHNYGTIRQGADGKCEFRFTNTGRDPLIIEKIETPCACVVTEWPKKAIRKGKTGVIKAEYYTKRLGEINKTLVVISNSSQEKIELKLIGKVEVQ